MSLNHCRLPALLVLNCILLLMIACTVQSTPEPTRSEITQPPPTNTPLPVPTSTVGIGSTRIRTTDGMTMVFVPAGEFLMGIDAGGWGAGVFESPQHLVALEAFFIDQTEVTNNQYQICVAAGVCKPPEENSSYSYVTYFGDEGFNDYPVLHVSWYQALSYCNWAGGRLPTEEEWEYAARETDGRWYPWGNQFDGSLLNYCDLNCTLLESDKLYNDGYGDTAPVGSYPKGVSWCGALDMMGNVWEWVMDWMAVYPGYPADERPPSVPLNTYRVIRGGAWDTNQTHIYVAYRNWLNPVHVHDSVGFRCASDP
jgi:formylglycine-generating enzyme required for sulfatase activity